MKYNKEFYLGVDSQIHSTLHKQGTGTESISQRDVHTFTYVYVEPKATPKVDHQFKDHWLKVFPQQLPPFQRWLTEVIPSE